MDPFTVIAEHIGRASGAPFVLRERRGRGGGCINDASVVADGARRFFVKTNRADLADMFAAEAEALAALAAAGSARVPAPICHGAAGGVSYLVLEHLDLRGSADAATLGTQLAALHRHRADRFGWHRDNTIGATAQPNGWDADWLRFWRERRLGFQLTLAARNGIGSAVVHRGRELAERLPALFAGYAPLPSLLHGDLWGGNAAGLADGTPVIFDPATYYGDREADLAMSELFGGFSPRFYAAYGEAWPLDAGYPVRKRLYNLYHLLNHFNLFGGGYAGQAEATIDRLLAELR